MRPPEFTGGNLPHRRRAIGVAQASMRPPEFTGGNPPSTCSSPTWSWCFNEAAGIHRRKPNPNANANNPTRGLLQ